MTFRVMLHNSS